MALYEFEGKKPQIAEDAFVHPQAVLIGDVSVEGGCYIGAGAVLRADFGRIVICAGSNVQDNSVLHQNHDNEVRVGRGVIIGHSAVLHDTLIGDDAFVGMSATLLPHAKVGGGALVAAGSLVPEGMEIPAGQMAAGNPARLKGPVGEQMRQRMARGRQTYQALAGRYLKGMRCLD